MASTKTPEKLNLRQLHQLHCQLQDLLEQVERGPRQLKARQTFTQGKVAELEAQRQKQKSLKMAADQRSLQLKTNEAKIQDLKGKLNSASSNREFDIIRAQIAADTMANSVLEDEILDALEQVDQAAIAVKKLEAEVAAAKSEEERVAREIAAAEPGLQARVAELRGELEASEAELPAAVLIAYRRLTQAHGPGALAEVDGATCTACYVSLPPQMIVELKMGHTTFCKTCGRLLYPAEK